MITTVIMTVSSMHTPRLGMIRLTRRVPARAGDRGRTRAKALDGDGIQKICEEEVLYTTLPHCRRMKQGLCGDGYFEAWIEEF